MVFTGVSPRPASLTTDPTDGPSLLNRAGFTLTTVDIEEITINYPSIWELMADLRDMGETNAILGRRSMISRDVLIAADSIYRELYQKEEGCVPATFQVIFMVGCFGHALAHVRSDGSQGRTSRFLLHAGLGRRTSRIFYRDTHNVPEMFVMIGSTFFAWSGCSYLAICERSGVTGTRGKEAD